MILCRKEPPSNLLVTYTYEVFHLIFGCRAIHRPTASPTGAWMSRGLSEHWGTDPRAVDLIIGTLSKAFVSCGGFIAAEARVLEWLHFTLPGFVFSVGLAPPIAAAAGAALRILCQEPWRIARLHAISQHFVAEADRLGLDIGPAIGHGVVPVLFRDNAETVACAEAMLGRGYYCPPIIQVGVPRDQPRLRFFLSVQHREADVTEALEIVAEAGLAGSCRRALTPRHGGRLIAQPYGDMIIPWPHWKAYGRERRRPHEDQSVVGKPIALQRKADQRSVEMMVVVLVVIDGECVNSGCRNDEAGVRAGSSEGCPLDRYRPVMNQKGARPGAIQGEGDVAGHATRPDHGRQDLLRRMLVARTARSSRLDDGLRHRWHRKPSRNRQDAQKIGQLP